MNLPKNSVNQYKNSKQNDIAVIGISCKVPGASNHSEFWNNLINKRRHTGEFPVDRSFKNQYKQSELKGVSTTCLNWGGFVDDMHQFDNAFFGIAESEANQMDPMQKKLLEATYSCFEDAGYAPASMNGTSTGVFLGITNLDFKEIKEANKEKNNLFTPLGSAMCFLPGRISYQFGLKGPSLALDTACSSSGLAIHYAIQSIHNNECNSAICGGANYIGTTTRHIESARLGLLSKKGKCASFDVEADGYVRSEGVGLIMIKRLKEAIADKDHIYGIIKASSVNHGGRGKNLIAPNIFAQTELIKRTLSNNDISPLTIGYLEAQAIGNPETDAMEFIAIKRAIENEDKINSEVKSSKCILGTYKPNIGHVEAFSGTLALIKSMLCFKYGIIPPTTGINTINPKIEKHLGRLQIEKECTDFEFPTDKKGNSYPRRIGINNFGLSNTNCFLLVEEYKLSREKITKPANRDILYPIILSAPSLPSLIKYCKKLVEYFEGEGAETSLADVCGTLISGRDFQNFRLGFSAKNSSDVINKLKKYLDGSISKEIYIGEKQPAVLELIKELELKEDESVVARIGKVESERKIKLWVKGIDINWKEFIEKMKWSKIALPVFSFNGGNYSYNESALTELKADKNQPLVKHSTDPKQIANGRSRLFVPQYSKSTGVPQRDRCQDLLLIADSVTDAIEYKKNIRRNAGVIIVVKGSKFKSAQDGFIEMDLYEELHYPLLLQEIDPKKNIEIICLNKLLADPDIKKQNKTLLFPIFNLSKQFITRKKTTTKIVLPFYENVQSRELYEMIAGFGRSLSMEVPSIMIQSLKVGENENLLNEALNELDAMSSQTDFLSGVFYSGGNRCIETMAQVYLTDEANNKRWLKENEVYIITGGFGGIGTMLTEHLLAMKPVRVILIGRSTMDKSKEACLEKWNRVYPGEVWYEKVDITQEEQLSNFIDKLSGQKLNPRGIFHTAGVQDDKWFKDKSWSEFETVLSSKVTGTCNLWKYFSPFKPDFITLFSSISSILGNIGQTDYAAANSFLNAFADSKNKTNETKVISICWPYWENGGMKISETVIDHMKSSYGFEPIKEKNAFEILDRIMSSDLERVIVFEGDEKRINEYLTSKRIFKSASPSNHADHLSDIIDKLLPIFSELLSVHESKLNVHESFESFGFNSMMIMGLTDEIERMFNISINPTIISDSNSVYTLAENLSKEVVATHSNELQKKPFIQEIEKDMETVHSEDDEYVAVIGMAGRFPQSDDVDEFWENISKGKELISKIPENRSEINAYCSNFKKDNEFDLDYIGGFINHISDFDASYFKIKEEEAMTMDFNQRVLLEETQHLFDQSGYSTADVSGKNISVFIAGQQTVFASENINQFNGNETKHFVVGQIPNMISARISQHFNLKGLSMVVNTACSGSIVAIHQACQGILNGENEMAIAGGIFLPLHPNVQIGFKEAGVISPSGKMCVFDQRANGIVLGEAVGLVLLKKLSKAIAEGDNILGIIRGSGVNNDGQTMGITTPNMHAQKELIETVYRKSKINPQDISYYEAHGTGTLLGDPIEIKAATEVFRKYTDKNQFCAVGSTKPNVGHSLTASGMAGFVKILSAFKNKQLPPTINCEQPHERFQFERSPFYPNTELKPWDVQNKNRIAAISSFGFGGTNSHVILEEYIPHNEWIQKRYSKPLTIFNRKKFIPGSSPHTEFKNEQQFRVSANKLSDKKTFVYNEPCLKDHTVKGEQILIGVTFLSLLIDFMRANFHEEKEWVLENLIFKHLIKFFQNDVAILHVERNQDSLQVLVKKNKDGALTEVASGIYKSSATRSEVSDVSLYFRQLSFKSADDLYDLARKADIFHGKSLRTLKEYCLLDKNVYGILTLDDELLGRQNYTIHPAFFDGALVAALGALEQGNLEDPFVPFYMKGVKILKNAEIGGKGYCFCSLAKKNEEVVVFNVQLFNEHYQLVAQLDEVTCKRIHKTKEESQEIAHPSGVNPVFESTLNDNLEDEVIAYLKEILENTSNIKNISLTDNFISQGFESMQLVNLASKIESQLKVKLYPTILFEYPNLDLFATYMSNEFGKEFNDFFSKNKRSPQKTLESIITPPIIKTSQQPKEKVVLPEERQEQFAIIGMAGRFPGGETIEEFWTKIKNGEQLITEIPKDRWDWKKYYSQGSYIPGHTNCKWGGFISNVNRFDNEFFGISEAEASMMDPQLRQLLEVAYECVENSGKIKQIRGADIGVYTGVCFHDYYDVMNRGNVQINEYMGTGNATTILANQLSNFFDFKGPSLTVDTACSSSLVAMHLAMQAMQAGDCSMALVSGVNLLFSPEHYIYFSSKGFLSPTGNTNSFGSEADGYVPSEAVVSILLRPLNKALAENDTIYAKIRASAVVHAGRSSHVTAPNARQQSKVMTTAWNKANITPLELTYLEGHGTGTNLGDAIELEGIKMSISNENTTFHLGSVKANIGHSEGASGLVSIVRVIMSMRDHAFPAMPAFKDVNALVTADGLPFKIDKKDTFHQVEPGKKMLVGVNSFGFGGTYAHILLESHQLQVENKKYPEGKWCLIPFSAKKQKSLYQQILSVENYIRASEKEGKVVNANDLSYTLFLTKEEFSEKVLFIVRDTTELLLLFQRVAPLKLAEPDEGIFCLNEQEVDEKVKHFALSWKKANSLKRQDWIAQFGIKGAELKLPSYVFDGKSFWYKSLESSNNSEPVEKAVESIKADIQQASEPLNQELLHKEINKIVSDVLGIESEFLEPDIELADFAIDSTQIYAISDQLGKSLKIEINPTLFFQVNNYGEFLNFLTNQFRVKNKSNAIHESAVVKEEPLIKNDLDKGGNDAIAIIGMHGIFPGAGNLDEFWALLSQGKGAIAEVSDYRIDELNTFKKKWKGAFIDHVDCFDYKFFNISKREACLMDPQQRLFLQVVCKTFEDGGINIYDSENQNAGIFVGVSTSDYLELINKASLESDPLISTGNAHSSIANKVSYLLNLKGPSEAVDTACSSSLVAIHRAVSAIRNSDCDMAIAGGVNLNFSDTLFEGFTKAGMLSPSGQCRPFSEEADGYIRGEGAGAILLKSHHKAIADGDRVYAVIRSVQINHGGKANTYTSPNSKRQAELICNAITKARIPVNTINFIEGHFTATKLGDPAELNGLKLAFETYAEENKSEQKLKSCGLGSVKGNIGHLESAAGIAGLLKVVLALQHECFPANINAIPFNSLLALENTGFYINTAQKKWPHIPGEDRRAGISSFGFGGTNAHLIIEEAPAVNLSNLNFPEGELLFVLSSKSDSTLKNYCLDYLNFLERNESERNPVSLSQIVYALQIRRSHFDHRIAIITSSLTHLKQCLSDIVNGTKNPAVFEGILSKKREESKTTIENLESFILPQAASEWVKGTSKINWKEVNKKKQFEFVTLPTYPFEETKAWYTYLAEEKTKNTRTTASAGKINTDWVYQFVWQEEKKQLMMSTNFSQTLILDLSGEATGNEHRKDYFISADYLNISKTSYQSGVDSLVRTIDSKKIKEIVCIDEDIDILSSVSTDINFVFYKSLLTAISACNAVLKFVYVTNRLQKTGLEDEQLNPSSAIPLGLIKVWGNENSSIDVHCLDFNVASTWSTLGVKELITGIKKFLELDLKNSPKGEFANRGNKIYSKRIQNVELEKSTDEKIIAGGTYIIIGGTGGIGTALSLYLAEKYKAALILIGRRQQDNTIVKQLNDIQKAGGSGRYIPIDVTANMQNEQLDMLQLQGVQGVFYLAMTNEAFTLSGLTENAFDGVTNPKVQGLKAVYELALKLKAGFMTIFSSSICLFNNAGQSAYVAACRFQDAFGLAVPEDSKLDVKIINWGFWGEAGRVANEDFTIAMEKSGTYPIYTLEGFQLMEKIITSNHKQLMAFKVDKKILDAKFLFKSSEGFTERLVETKSILNQLHNHISKFLN